jgi:hypothetical protein
MIEVFSKHYSFETLLKDIRSNKYLLNDYVNNLILEYYNIHDLKVLTVSIHHLLQFIPLPTKFVVQDDDEIVYNNSTHTYEFNTSSRINNIITDKILPGIDINLPLPFTFPVVINNKLDLFSSNVYYYEIKITELDTAVEYTDTINNVISIGFSQNNLLSNFLLGSKKNSIGFYPFNGIVKYNSSDASISKNKFQTKTINIGDTIGSGVIFKSINKIVPFFTVNDKLVFMNKSPIHIKSPWVPVFSYSKKIKLRANFSTEPFVFNIVDMINYNSVQVLSLNNTFITDGHDVSKHMSHTIDKQVNLFDTNTLSAINNILNNTILQLPFSIDNNSLITLVTTNIISNIDSSNEDGNI